MKGKRFIIVGGVLLALYGAMFLYNNVNITRPLEAGIFGIPLPYLTIILPSCLIAAGLLGIFTGIFNNWKLLSVSRYIGLRLAIMVVLLQASAAITRSDFFVLPVMMKPVSWLNFIFAGNSIYLINVLALAVCVHIYLTGIEAAYNKGWNAYIITRSVTRILFVLAAGIFFYSQLARSSEKMSTLAYAACAGWIMVIFERIRAWADNESAGFTIFLSLVCVPVIFLYFLIISWFGWILSWFLGLAVFIPITLIVILLFLTCWLITREDRSSYSHIVYNGDGTWTTTTADGTKFLSGKNGKSRIMSQGEVAAREAEKEEKRQAEKKRIAENNRINAENIRKHNEAEDEWFRNNRTPFG
jgi:signal transduction histidine kinase